ncbi:hypothetical protein JCM5350_006005 [Sporobolomyces pararoseus]
MADYIPPSYSPPSSPVKKRKISQDDEGQQVPLPFDQSSSTPSSKSVEQDWRSYPIVLVTSQDDEEEDVPLVLIRKRTFKESTPSSQARCALGRGTLSLRSPPNYDQVEYTTDHVLLPESAEPGAKLVPHAVTRGTMEVETTDGRVLRITTTHTSILSGQGGAAHDDGPD